MPKLSPQNCGSVYPEKRNDIVSISEGLSSVSEPVNKLLTPIATSAGQSLADIWDLVFGGFGNYVAKKRIERQKALEDFKKSLFDEVSDIPEDKICEPPLSIVGPALEASKYYFQEPELRALFAKLIAASMNSDKSHHVHPSFIEIIKQMSPLDAQNITYFDRPLPTVEYRAEKETGEFQILLTNAFFSNPDIDDLNMQARSLSSLSRLGLIYTTYDRHLKTDELYSVFEHCPQYVSFEALCTNHPGFRLKVKKGIAELTPLGADFRHICFEHL